MLEHPKALSTLKFFLSKNLIDIMDNQQGIYSLTRRYISTPYAKSSSRKWLVRCLA